MAQTEDTELRDLVMEALEKNGSLAKIRALLRANVFLAFEEDCENVKHNISLDNILKVPEGILSLSLVHEFLEFCNLKNTLFVFTSETRQGKEYSYEGPKKLAEKLHCYKREQIKEPLLMTLVKNLTKSFQRKFYDQGDNANAINKEDQNCTYIVHEDSSNASSQSNSQSDQSSDEKNKLHLRLPLDNSDTDTSSDSMREKTSSEYIANEHIVMQDESEDENKSNTSQHSNCMSDAKSDVHPSNKQHSNTEKQQRQNDLSNYNFHSSDLGVGAPNSTESTSYIDLKPLNTYTEKLLNTSGLPTQDSRSHRSEKQLSIQDKVDSPSASTLSNVTSISSKHTQSMNKKISPEETNKSDNHSPEYTYDFSSSPSKNREADGHQILSPVSIQEFPKNTTKGSAVDSPHQHSQSSQSSVSISDVADLIELSAANSPMPYRADGIKDSKTSPHSVHKSELSINSRSKDENHHQHSDDSGDFTESPIASLSNLSLDFHSD